MVTAVFSKVLSGSAARKNATYYQVRSPKKTFCSNSTDHPMILFILLGDTLPQKVTSKTYFHQYGGFIQHCPLASNQQAHAISIKSFQAASHPSTVPIQRC